MGEPRHGRFAYRCSKRCKAYRSISESSLNTTVWNAVSEAFKNPEVIVEAIAAASKSSKTRIEGEEKEIERGLLQIDAEESRVLEAYRLEIFSPEQLARELEMIRARRAMLQSRKSTRDWTKQLDGTPIQKTLGDYCQAIAERLNALDLEKRQRLLRLLVGSIVFENDHVRIRCIVPCPDGNSPNIGTMPPEGGPLLDAQRIESITSYPYARNVAESFGSPEPLTFELVRRVVKDRTAARAASLANLIKANRTLRKRGKADRTYQ